MEIENEEIWSKFEYVCQIKSISFENAAYLLKE